MKRQEVKGRLVSSYFFGLGVLLPNQFWTGTYVGDAPWIVLSLMQAFLFLPLAVVSQKGGRYNPFLFGFGLVATELLLRTVPFTGFGWSRLSFTQVDSFFAVIYPLLGSVGVGFLIAFVVANRNLLSFILLALVIVGLNLWPNHQLAKDQFQVDRKSVV